MKKASIIILFLSLFLTIHGADSELEVEVLKSCEDLNIDEIKKSLEFKLIEEPYIHNSSSECEFWIKLTTKSKWKDSDYLFLGNNINNFEEIYFINQNGIKIKENTIGTDQYYQSNTYIPSFQLRSQYASIFIRIKSFSFLKESFKIREIKSVNLTSSKYLVLYVFVISILLVLALYFFLLYLKSKRKVILYYTFYILAVINATFFISNFGRYFLWDKLPVSNVYLEGVMVMFLVVFYNLFAAKATYLKSWSVVAYNINKSLLFGYPILFVVALLFQIPFMLSIASKLLPGIALLLLIIMVIQNLRNRNVNSNFFLLGFLFFLMGVVIRILINEGFINHTFSIEVFILISIILEVFVFSYVVINHLDKEFIKGQKSTEELLISSARIEELKSRLEKLNNSFENSQNTALISVDASINEVLVTPLSKREIEVLNSIIKGNKYKETSEELHISINTLKTHVSRIYSKLEINNRVEAINKITKLSHLKK